MVVPRDEEGWEGKEVVCRAGRRLALGLRLDGTWIGGGRGVAGEKCCIVLNKGGAECRDRV